MSYPVVSVVLPVYNVGQFLERCLDSLVYQSCLPIEIIAVNDGSTDNSREILENYRSRLPMMKIVDQENRGLAETRNIAFMLASGKFIYCLDSDDYITPKCIEIIIREMEQYQLDVLFFSTHLEFHDNIGHEKNISRYYQRPRKVLDKILSAEVYFNTCITERVKTGQGYSVVVWGYAFRRETYSNLTFKTRIFEDEYFTTELLLSRPDARVKCIAARLYWHTLRKGSITTTSNKAKRALAILETLSLLLVRIGEINNVVTVKCLDQYMDLLYIDAIKYNLNDTMKVFSAHKIICYLSSRLDGLYIDSSTENGLILLLKLVNRVAQDTGVVNEGFYQEIKSKLIMAIENKKTMLSINKVC